MIDFFDGSTNFNTGIFFEYNNFVWGGYDNLNFNDLHSLFVGCVIVKRFRAGYSYDFTKLFSGKSVNLHEFLLGFRLN